MSWGTEYIHNHYFSRETFDTLQKVEDAIEDDEEYLKQIEQQLISLALMTEPSKIIQLEDCTSYLTTIPNMVSEYLKEYRSTYFHKTLLMSLKSEWNDCHTKIQIEGKEENVAKCPPKGFNPPYLCGDFIKTNNIEEE